LPQEDLWFDPVNTARQTRSWYRYQDECVAYRCIPNLIEGSIDRIVVEWATDYVVIAKDGSVELVSVKHRGANTSPWTLGQLARERVLTDYIASGPTSRKPVDTALNQAKDSMAGKRALFWMLVPGVQKTRHNKRWNKT
jgi:hypothetical protein